MGRAVEDDRSTVVIKRRAGGNGHSCREIQVARRRVECSASEREGRIKVQRSAARRECSGRLRESRVEREIARSVSKPVCREVAIADKIDGAVGKARGVLNIDRLGEGKGAG